MGVNAAFSDGWNVTVTYVSERYHPEGGGMILVVILGSETAQNNQVKNALPLGEGLGLH
jgi:hypothetical protein